MKIPVSCPVGGGSASMSGRRRIRAISLLAARIQRGSGRDEACIEGIGGRHAKRLRPWECIILDPAVDRSVPYAKI
jgi:hypothetical protein